MCHVTRIILHTISDIEIGIIACPVQMLKPAYGTLRILRNHQEGGGLLCFIIT